MSLLFPTLPEQPGLTAVFHLPLHLWLGMCIGDLGWGPRTRHLVLFQFKFVPLFLWGGNHAASRKTTSKVYTHTGYRARRAGIYNSYGSYKRTEAWYKRQSGQDRQSDTPIRESQSGDLMVFFLPLMQYECYLKYYPSRLPMEVFLYLNYGNTQSVWTCKRTTSDFKQEII